MGIKLGGVDKLTAKLMKLSKIEAKKMVHKTAESMEESVRNVAKEFSNSEYKCIAKADERDYGTSYFIDVGLKNDSARFDEWKGLYFQNYGFHNEGLGGRFHGAMVYNYVNWFDNAVKEAEREVMNSIKKELRKEIRAFND